MKNNFKSVLLIPLFLLAACNSNSSSSKNNDEVKYAKGMRLYDYYFDNQKLVPEEIDVNAAIKSISTAEINEIDYTFIFYNNENVLGRGGAITTRSIYLADVNFDGYADICTVELVRPNSSSYQDKVETKIYDWKNKQILLEEKQKSVYFKFYLFDLSGEKLILKECNEGPESPKTQAPTFNVQKTAEFINDAENGFKLLYNFLPITVMKIYYYDYRIEDGVEKPINISGQAGDKVSFEFEKETEYIIKFAVVYSGCLEASPEYAGDAIKFSSVQKFDSKFITQTEDKDVGDLFYKYSFKFYENANINILLSNFSNSFRVNVL